MTEWWPNLDEGILSHLQRVFVTPLRLDAAFDNDEESALLVESEFPDILPEDMIGFSCSPVTVEGRDGQAFEARACRGCERRFVSAAIAWTAHCAGGIF